MTTYILTEHTYCMYVSLIDCEVLTTGTKSILHLGITLYNCTLYIIIIILFYFLLKY
jgi:hypothetical protein